MSIEIIDGFKLNTAKPIDTRIVASGSVARNAMLYKYEGLRVYDTFDSIPYVWINNAWASENSAGIAGSGTTNYVSKFSNSNVLGNSLLFDNGTTVLLGTTASNNSYKMYINGNFFATNLTGNGSLLTNISASNVTGKLSLVNLPNTTLGYVLVSGPSTDPQWILQSSLSVGTINVTNTSSGDNYVTFVNSTSGANTLYLRSDGLKFNAATSQLSVYVGSAALPTFTFISDTTTGIYRPTAGVIGISILGVIKTQFDTSGVKLIDGAVTTPSFSFISEPTTGIYKISSGVIGLSILGVMKGKIDVNGVKSFDGTETSPGFSFIGYASTGIYRETSKLNVSVNGVKRAEFNTSGVRVTGTFIVSLATTLSTTLSVIGASTLSSTLYVAGTSTLFGAATLPTSLRVASNGSVMSKIVAGNIDMFSNGSSPVGYGQGFSLSVVANYPGASYWGQVLKVSITGGIPVGLQPVITATINHTGIIGSQIITGFNHYDGVSGYFHIQVGDIPNAESFLKVSFIFIQST